MRKKIVQENTWHNASTYHWDLSLQDYRRILRGHLVRIVNRYSREFFVPQSLLRLHPVIFPLKEKLLRLVPVWKYTGSDLVVVAQKLGVPATAQAPAHAQAAAGRVARTKRSVMAGEN